MERGVTEPFVLPVSKLSPAYLRRPLVERPRLVQSLRQSTARRLVVVTAEAGYGKTCLLVSALANLDASVAWLTLDETDTDPNILGAGIILAVRKVVAGIGQAALDVLTTGPSHEGLATAVASTLKELLTDTILVIDDFHVLDDNPAGGALIDHVL